MDLTPASGFRRRPAASSPSGVRETASRPPPRSPSLSPSSSDPSSPLSTSSSVRADSSAYRNHVKGQTRGSEVARVSSTSASLATQSSSTLAPDATSSKLSPRKSAQPRVRREEEEGGKRDMYDPFQPTDGAVGGEGEKYDPFDPTGSPASDDDDDDDESGKVRGGKRTAERGGDDEEKEEEPPDSTDALTDLSTQLPLRRRVDCRSARTRERRGADSDHSELEEGEIVGAVDRDGGKKRPAAELLPMNPPSVSFFGSKPERILRVLDGDGFVSVRTESNWEEDGDPEDEPVVGVEDLRRKLVSRRKERYLSFPASSPLSPQPPPPSHLPVSTPSSPLAAPIEQVAKNRSKSSKSSKSSKDSDRQKSKDRKAGEKEEKKKKSRKDKEGGQERSKEKERGHKAGKEVKARRSSRSSSRKRKKRQRGSPEASSGRGAHTRQPFSSLPEERHREKERDKDKDRGRERDRDREREPSRTSSHRRDERYRESSPRKEEKERKGRPHSSSRERGVSKSSKRSREEREGDGDRQRERERGRDGRPVVPPSIQDLNGSDLFAIKRTITVTTTTTTTTVPGSPRLASPGRPVQDSDEPHKRKKKRKCHSVGETDDRGSCRSRSQSTSPPRYHGYDSDNYSDKLVIDVLSLDGEALDSDYPSLEDTPPAALCPDPAVPGPKTKTTPKTGKHHPKKKSHASKTVDQSSAASSSKGKCLSSLTVTSGSAAASSGLPSTKRARKTGKDKVRDKGSRKDAGHSGKSKKESGGSRKGKLQSKVSVLVRDGVSSTTGASVGSGKMGMDLLGTGAPGSSVGGDSIAVVFCRDNESRSPFLKPCSEPLGHRGKDLLGLGKRGGRVAPPSSLSGPAGPKPKRAKPSSITSTSASSSASSPSSSLASKRRRRLAKKTREKGGGGPAAGDDGRKKAPSEGRGGASSDVRSASGDRGKSASPHVGQAGPAPCSSSSSSSSSSSTGVLPPSSSPPRTPPPSAAPPRDPRDSSPDSQTVDSSCKTPETSFPAEDGPTQTSPAPPASSPPAPQGAGLGLASSTPAAKPPPDDAPTSLASPPCSASSAGGGFTSLSLPLSSSDLSSSSSVSSSSASKPPPPPPAVPALPWGLPTGVDCTTGGVLALTALLFKMEEANIASRAKAQEFIHATSQILSQANQSQSQQLAPPSSASSSQIPPPPSLPPPPGLSPAQFILHGSLPLGGCTNSPPSLLHPSVGGGWAQTPPSIVSMGSFGDAGWDNESKDPHKYLKKLHTQERAVEEVKLAIKPYYQRKDINKDDYKDILRKAVHKICHSRTGDINPVKVSNLVKLYVQRYKYFRKHGRRMDDEERDDRELR